jgi:O-antigen biosynthesis protein
VAQAVPVHPAIRYHYSPDRRTIGAKRNAACHMSKGTVIMHWDDDDWAAPTWISTQVRMLAESQADITGLSSIRFYDPMSRRAWLYEYPDDQPAWVAGATLCYYKTFWQRNPFPEINIGEDNAFVWSSTTKVIVPHDAQHLYAARVHHGNTSAKRTRDPRWRPIQYQEIEEMMEVEERP